MAITLGACAGKIENACMPEGIRGLGSVVYDRQSDGLKASSLFNCISTVIHSIRIS